MRIGLCVLASVILCGCACPRGDVSVARYDVEVSPLPLTKEQYMGLGNDAWVAVRIDRTTGKTWHSRSGGKWMPMEEWKSNK